MTPNDKCYVAKEIRELDCVFSPMVMLRLRRFIPNRCDRVIEAFAIGVLLPTPHGGDTKEFTIPEHRLALRIEC
jgi:hypothetical protein